MSEKYFLGAMTQNGFSTEFGKIMADKEYFTFILKGGAGTGKSSLMKKIAAEIRPPSLNRQRTSLGFIAPLTLLPLMQSFCIHQRP